MDSESNLRVYRDDFGREFHYIYLDNGSKNLGVHFSAFFGEWGESPKYRETFGGYFHRRNMLGSSQMCDWLFLCDAYGADGNGTYYTGKFNDLFVERAIYSILEIVGVGSHYNVSDVVTIGSSMGATAALKFGISLGVNGIIAICPHIDLDVCAMRQGRQRHVSWILESDSTEDSKYFSVTRQINNLVDDYGKREISLPRLFIQSCKDDDGVHLEQVVPLFKKWRRSGGDVIADFRRLGGHTSQYATRALILRIAESYFQSTNVPLWSLRHSAKYRSEPLAKIYVSNLITVLSRLKSRINSPV